MNRFGVIVTYNKNLDKCTILASGEYDELNEFRLNLAPVANFELMLLDFDQKEFEMIKRDADKINERFRSNFKDDTFADFSDF